MAFKVTSPALAKSQQRELERELALALVPEAFAAGTTLLSGTAITFALSGAQKWHARARDETDYGLPLIAHHCLKENATDMLH